MSVALHCIVLGILICVPLTLVPEVQYTIVEIKLVSPRFTPRSPAQPKPPVIRVPLVFAHPRVKEPRLASKQELKIPEPHLAPKKAVEVEVQAREVRPPPIPVQVPPPPPAVVTPEVKVGAFSGSPAAETLNRKPRELVASGFEDRKDMPRQTGVRAEVAPVGTFDVPSGTDLRSGSARKSREIVSGGFAGKAGSASPDAAEPRGSVREGGFGDVHAAVNAAQKRPEPVRPALLGPEIISKPKPAYTREARALGLQGEVVLEVLFTAAGDVRVLTVIRGLGHGLDEAAVQAAEQIRFKPAQRDGKPVDSRSVVQIIFRLT